MPNDDAPIFFEVAVAAPIHHTLTYSPPPGVGVLPPGHRLLVPLGRRQLTGYLLAATTTPPRFKSATGEEGGEEGKTSRPGKIRAALAVLDPEPLFPPAMVFFFRWIAEYYHHPIGEVIQNALPAGLSRRSVSVIQLTPAGALALAEENQRADSPEWLAELLNKGELSPSQSAAVMRRSRKVVGRWQKDGWLQISSRLKSERVRPKTEVTIRLMPESNYPTQAGGNCSAVPQVGASGPAPRSVGYASRADRPKMGCCRTVTEEKTLALLRELVGDSPHGLPRRELLKHYPGAGRALKSLAAMGLVQLAEQRLYRDPFGEPPPFFARPAQLTAEQEEVLSRILPAVAAGDYAPFLLHGVTGSGKTEIYLRAAEATLKQGRQVLVLVPEIALATQLEGHFCSRFGDRVALLHSGLSAGERFDQWSLLLNGTALIVIGARSAIFAPLPDPGLIIVDEEHDPAYKQEDQLRYNARDLALLRGMQQRATVILGSATPAVSSYFQAQKGKFQLLTMSKRVEDRPLPTVEIVDLKEVKTVSGYPPLFSPQLIRALKENLTADHQSLVFLNRRGWANMMLCKDCGRPVQCEHCQVSLTLHKERGQLLCHHCGYHLPRNVVCPTCRSGTLVSTGFGTERLEEELRRIFPKARIARLDQDTTRDRKEFLAVLKAVRNLEIDILIGTQMITKGHHFPRVTLVGIVWADAGLGIPDYKAGERTFQLLTQVTGRAGRGEFPGRVLVQTLQAEHYSVALAQTHDYQGLYQQELALRRRLNFPPFGRLINLRLDGEQEERVRSLALGLGELARKFSGGRVTVLGPAAAPLARLRGRYRWQLLLKGGTVEELHRLCRRICDEFARLPGASTVKLSLDVDPENMV